MATESLGKGNRRWRKLLGTGVGMSSPQWGKPGATELQPTVARLVLPDLPVTQDKPGKSQVLNAGNYLTFLRSKTKATPVQMKHSTYRLPVATSAWAFSNIFFF